MLSLFAFFTFIMVLTSPPSANTTPSDSSNAEGVLQSLYRAVSAPFSLSTGDLDVTLLEKDPSVSSSDTGGMVLPTMTVTPTEGSMIDRLRSVQQSGKSVGLMDSSGGLGVVDSRCGIDDVVSDTAKFSSLVAGGDSFDDHILMEDQNNTDYNAFADTSFLDPNLLSLDNADASDSMTLCNQLTLDVNLRFRAPTLLPKVERRVKISGSFDVVKLLLVQYLSVTIYGGVIGTSGSHAC